MGTESTHPVPVPAVALARPATQAIEKPGHLLVGQLPGQPGDQILDILVGTVAMFASAEASHLDLGVVAAEPVQQQVHRVLPHAGGDLHQSRTQDVLAQLGGRPLM